MKTLLRLFLVIAGIAFLTPAHAEETKKDIVVTNAWVRLMPPSQTTTAAYMVIENNTDKEVILEGASTDVAGMTHLHQMGHKDGMMTMGSAGEIHIPSKGKATLEPGGLHLMLMDLKKPLNKGDQVPLTLNFQGGNNIVVNADVREEVEDAKDSMAGMKM